MSAGASGRDCADQGGGRPQERFMNEVGAECNPKGKAMSDFKLIRVAIDLKGAFGVLLHENLPSVVTLERTYNLSIRGYETIIQEGIWRCDRTTYFKGGYKTFEIHIPNHTRILFHRGNIEEDSEGCILIGKSFNDLKSQPGIANSNIGFGEFMWLTRNLEEFQLEVKNGF